MMREIADISYEITGSELIALLKESEDIKTLSPKFNRAQRKIRFNVGIIQYQDQNGYSRLSIDRKSVTNAPSYLKFTSQGEARQFLHQIVRKGNLCQKLTGLQTGKGPCFEQHLGMCNGACEKKESASVYNSRVKKSLESYSLAGDSYLIKDVGRSADEYSVAWVQNGAYQGYGYFFHDIQDINVIKEGVKKAMDNRDVIGIIKSFINKNSLKIIPVKNNEQSGVLF